MNEEAIKEHLSEAFLRVLGNRRGFSCTRPGDDYGVDLMVNRVLAVENDGRVTYRMNGDVVQFQLKCTTENGIERDAEVVKYDLKVKNFNDLIARRQDASPLYLLLYVIPIDPELWILDDQANSKLSLLGEGYWYLPDEDASASENDSTQRIYIPNAQRVNLGFIPNLFEEIYG